MVVDEKNRITEIKGLDELAKSMAANPVSANVMKQFQDKDALDQMMNTWVGQTLPQHPVKAGDQWPIDVHVKLGQMGKIRLVGTYHFMGFAPCAGVDCAVLDLDGKMELDFTATGKDEASKALTTLAPKLKDGVVKNRIYWDNGVGWMRSMEMQQTMTTTMKNPANGTVMSIPIEQKISTTVTIK
jgi:hypothetical protein